MPKAKTLTDRARAYWRRHHPRSIGIPIIDSYLAGHRANRLTKAERAVVEAAKVWERNTSSLQRDCYETPLSLAVRALERAKGRK